jgi:hypothetical protein
MHRNAHNSSYERVHANQEVVWAVPCAEDER